MSSASEELNQYWPPFRQSKRYAPLLGIRDAEIKHILTGIVELVMAQNQHHIKAWQINEIAVALRPALETSWATPKQEQRILARYASWVNIFLTWLAEAGKVAFTSADVAAVMAILYP